MNKKDMESMYCSSGLKFWACIHCGIVFTHEKFVAKHKCPV